MLLCKGCKQPCRRPWKRGGARRWRRQHGDHSSGEAFLLAWQERKNLLGPAPLDDPPPMPTWPSRVVQRRPTIVPQPPMTSLLHAMSLCVESAPPCVSEAEGPSTCRAPGAAGTSSRAPQQPFCEGRAARGKSRWQHQMFRPLGGPVPHQAPVEEGPSKSGVFIAAALQANRGVLQPLPEQRAQCPVSAVPCQRSSPEPRQPVSERPPQPAARHKEPPPTQRPVEPAPD